MNRILFGALLSLLLFHQSAVPTHPAAALDDDKPKPKAKSSANVYKGRVIAPVMSAEGGAAWLERSDRDATEQPEKVLDALKIAPGSTVADIGAGTGYFSIRIAKRLGPEGRVIATDLQPEMLRQLTENMKKAGGRNIDRVLATAADAKLPPNKVDLALMVDVYHELQDPERTMAQIRRSLKDDGRLVLVEYRAEDPSVPILPEHKTTLRQVRYEIEPMGFRLREVFEFLPHQHIEVFVKDEVQGEEEIIDPSDFPTIRKPGWAGTSSAPHYEKAGFERLFNGKDLSGWNGSAAAWSIRGGAIVGNSTGSPSGALELKTTDSRNDFELDLQWALKDADCSAGVWIGSNPRLLIRLDPGVPYEAGYPNALATRRTGEVAVEGGKDPIQPTSDTANAVVLPGEWNRLTVRCSGRRVAIAINGVQTADFEVGANRLTGPLALQPLQGGVEFREVWIRRLGQ